MTDWKTKCERFSIDHQEPGMLYPNSCSMGSAKTVKDLISLSQTVSKLNGKIENMGKDYQATEDDKRILKQSMKDFCCAMWSRTEFEKRNQEVQEDYIIAKQRVESVRNPPANLSYMGTIVPLGRPLRSDSVPILLITSLVFIILGLGLLLNIGNIQLAYVGPRSYGPGLIEQLRTSFQQTSWAVIGITVLASAGIAGGIFYGIQKTNPELLNK
jgi:hypothetical protein